MEKSITEIVWANPAKVDLKDIFEYIAEFSEDAALRIITKILDRVEILKGFPEIGPIEPLLSHKTDGYRYLVEGNYKIIYRITGVRVIIVTVFDARQNPQKMEKKVSR